LAGSNNTRYIKNGANTECYRTDGPSAFNTNRDDDVIDLYVKAAHLSDALYAGWDLDAAVVCSYSSYRTRARNAHRYYGIANYNKNRAYSTCSFHPCQHYAV
jgi:hypothetical protein